MISSSTSLFGARSATDSSDGAWRSRPLFSLEICRGRTAFPNRPVHTRRFLIGAAGGCHLRLGGDDVSPIHSIIVVDGPDIWLEAIVQFPQLKVNGNVESSVRLKEGDLIEIGCFEFILREPHVCQDEVGRVEKTARPDEQVPHGANTPQNLGDLSAAELVELIEHDQRIIEEFQAGVRRDVPAAARLEGGWCLRQQERTTIGQNTNESSGAKTDRFSGETNRLSGGRLRDKPLLRRAAGADALLHEVLRRAQSSLASNLPRPQDDVVSDAEDVPVRSSTRTADTPKASENEPRDESGLSEAADDASEQQLLHEVDVAARKLDAFAAELERRSERLSRREAGYAEAAALLLDAQQRLGTQLEALLHQMSAMRSDSTKPARKVA